MAKSVGYREIIAAASRGDVLAMKTIISSDPDLSGNMDMAMLRACENGQLSIVDFLIESGANLGSIEDRRKLLCSTVDRNQIATVQFLLDKGLNANSCQGNTPLQIAAGKGYLAMCKLLLSREADVTDHANYALMTALLNHHLDVAVLLLSHGASMGVVRYDDLSLAIQKDHRAAFICFLPNFKRESKDSLFRACVRNNAVKCTEFMLTTFPDEVKPNFRLKRSDEMNDLFLSYRTKTALSNRLSKKPLTDTGAGSEPNL